MRSVGRVELLYENSSRIYFTWLERIHVAKDTLIYIFCFRYRGRVFYIFFFEILTIYLLYIDFNY